jgi:hypothetical protein
MIKLKFCGVLVLLLASLAIVPNFSRASTVDLNGGVVIHASNETNVCVSASLNTNASFSSSCNYDTWDEVR